MMNIAARFSLSKKPRYVDQESGDTPTRAPLTIDNELACLQLVPTWNLHTTQPNTLLPTYDEVVNLTGLLEIKE
jgi:hypothetical protein